jgi:dsRNA-specific ribonuclease
MDSLKAIIYTLYTQNQFKPDYKHIKDKLMDKYPEITEEFIEEELEEMLYILKDEESKLGYYKQMHDEEQQFKQLIKL